ncbi:hypothetical protein HMPREF9120_02379 [Neisseria sp. oral taxon 020 str. F0370]|nr:hypothetical protein CGZ77_04615 [Neisseria sp. KEM232]EKY04244.1 hypothetical protein HMPREF9120_02379 [Neisseria sp. oral taxon 020 str. F0370]
MLTISLAAVFLVKIHACRVKNARKMSNLAALFSLQARIFPQKTASQADYQHTLGRWGMAAKAKMMIKMPAIRARQRYPAIQGLAGCFRRPSVAGRRLYARGIGGNRLLPAVLPRRPRRNRPPLSRRNPRLRAEKRRLGVSAARMGGRVHKGRLKTVYAKP